MNKTFILLAGLPASGKDTIADFLKENDFYVMTYSKEILKPIIEETEKTLNEFFKETIGFISEEKLNEIVKYIKKLKEEQKGRDLYISVAMYLNKIISELTDKEYNHFSLFANRRYKNENKITIAGFRIEEEVNILKKCFTKAKIITILIEAEDELRYQWIKKRDGIDEKTIKKNEKYERESTYNKLRKEFKFDYIIENNSSLENLKQKTIEILKVISN